MSSSPSRSTPCAAAPVLPASTTSATGPDAPTQSTGHRRRPARRSVDRGPRTRRIGRRPPRVRTGDVEDVGRDSSERAPGRQSVSAIEMCHAGTEVLGRTSAGRHVDAVARHDRDIGRTGAGLTRSAHHPQAGRDDADRRRPTSSPWTLSRWPTNTGPNERRPARLPPSSSRWPDTGRTSAGRHVFPVGCTGGDTGRTSAGRAPQPGRRACRRCSCGRSTGCPSRTSGNASRLRSTSRRALGSVAAIDACRRSRSWPRYPRPPGRSEAASWVVWSTGAPRRLERGPPSACSPSARQPTPSKRPRRGESAGPGGSATLALPAMAGTLVDDPSRRRALAPRPA